MLIRVCVGVLLTNFVAMAQTIQPSKRQVEHFEVTGASRLAALAKLGSLSNTSLLIEVDSLPELQAPVAISIDRTTVSAVAGRLLPAEYVLRDVGSLLIISPRAGARNRILNLPLGLFALRPIGISGLEPFLGFTIGACHRLQTAGLLVGWPSHGPSDSRHLAGSCNFRESRESGCGCSGTVHVDCDKRVQSDRMYQ